MRAGCFALFVFVFLPVSRDCCVALPHDVMVCLQFVIVIVPDYTHYLLVHTQLSIKFEIQNTIKCQT